MAKTISFVNGKYVEDNGENVDASEILKRCVGVKWYNGYFILNIYPVYFTRIQEEVAASLINSGFKGIIVFSGTSMEFSRYCLSPELRKALLSHNVVTHDNQVFVNFA